jgi:exodeoxyribonuclease VII large subunit
MTNHPSTDAADHNQPVWSVGEISVALKRHIEGAFDRVRVRGEISGLRRAASGHMYFALKDSEALLKGVCWRAAASRLGVGLEDGIEVIVSGRLTTYPGRSEYQIVADSIEPSGEGALLKMLDERRRRLAAEGLFDATRKKPTPFLPDVIGIVTSPTGAVIRDILHRLADRFPRRVLLWPVAVQGESAADQVAAAIDGFNRLSPDGPVTRPDVIIVARGGGSLEDLWAFNEEVVVRAAAASVIPLISAIGHETDTTLIDFAADLRAPTPTAAAEMAVPVRIELIAQVMDAGTRMVGAVHRRLAERRTHVAGLARGLPRPWQLVEGARQRLDDWSERLANSLVVGLDRRRQRLAAIAARIVSPLPWIERARDRLAAETRMLGTAMRVPLADNRARLDRLDALLESYSYQGVLERGFVVVHDRTGRAVTTAAATRPGMPLVLQFRDGSVDAIVAGRDAGPATGRRSSPAAESPTQGRLL